MRPLKFMWNVGVKYPSKAAGALVGMELRGWMTDKVAAQIKEEHEAAGDTGDVLPSTFKRGVYGHDHVAIDIDGNTPSKVRSVHPDFVPKVNNLEPGLVLVTARIDRDSRGVKDIGAYVNGIQVGWLETRRSAPLPGLKNDWEWIVKLNKMGFLPRFKGHVMQKSGGGRYVVFLLPKWSEWLEITSVLKKVGSPRRGETADRWLDRIKRENKDGPLPSETTREWLDRIKRVNKEGRDGS